MAQSVGEIGLDLVVNQNQFNRQMSGITGLAKKAGAALAAAFAVKKIVDFGKECLELGSDLAEVQNVVDVTFPSMTAQVDQFAKSAASSFGLSETMAKQYTGMFGAMAKAFGFTEQQAYEMGATLTGLAGDVASFYNISQDEAYTKLKAVFSGETEVLKDLGIVMTQNALDAYAMANGYGKTTQAMTEAEKVALRYAFVQDQLSAASGDFARTSDSWANQVRILKLQFDSLKATLGQGLINLFTPIVKGINAIIAKLSTAANAFKAFTELITGNKSSGSGAGITQLADTAADAGEGMDNASSSASDLADHTSDVGSAAKKAAKEMRALMGFDKINRLDDSSADSSDSGSTSGDPSPSGSGAGIGSAVDYGGLAQGETVVDKLGEKFSAFFERVKSGVQPTVDALKRLWTEGLSQLGGFAWTALKDFYENFLVPVGKWVFGEGIPRFVDALNNGLMAIDWDKINGALNDLWEALTPFAINIGEGLLWFWENVLVPLGTWTANEVVPRFLETLAGVIESCNAVLEALQPLFQWFWDNVLLPIAQWTGGVFLSIWDGINSALKSFSDWCETLQPKVQGIVDKLTDLKKWASENSTVLQILGIVFAGLAVAIAANAIASNALTIAMGLSSVSIGVYNGVTTIATAVTGAFSAVLAFLTSPITLVVLAITALVAVGVLLYQNWDTIKAKAIEIWGAIKEWFFSVVEAIKEFFTGWWSGIQETFANVGAWFTEKFQAAKDGITSAFSNIGEWFSEKYERIKAVFAGVAIWFKAMFMAAVVKIKGAFAPVTKFFSGVWSGIKSAFGNITGWFRDKFSAAWQAVKNVFSKGGEVFSGIKEGILESLKSVINGLIGGINNIVTIPFDGLNWALDNLRNIDIAGFYPFEWLPSIDTPQIPYLAKGGYVRPNTPQLAMIGDNRHQGEVVAPEDKLREMALEAAKAAGGSGITKEDLESVVNYAVLRLIAALADMGFYLDGKQLAKAEQSAKAGLQRQFNSVEVI